MGIGTIPAIILFIANMSLLVLIYRKDRTEKESIWVLLVLFFFGALITEIAGIFNWFAENFWSEFFDPQGILGVFSYYLLGVGFFEEFCKFFVLKKFSWNSKEFNYTFDGIVYASAVATGFSLAEDFLYVSTEVANGYSSVLQVTLMRGVLEFIGHVGFALFMGVFYGEAKKFSAEGAVWKSRGCQILAILVPALIHGFYDAVLSLDFLGGYGYLVGLVLVAIAIGRVWRLILKGEMADRAIPQDLCIIQTRGRYVKEMGIVFLTLILLEIPFFYMVGMDLAYDASVNWYILLVGAYFLVMMGRDYFLELHLGHLQVLWEEQSKESI
ncbi:MAG: PrsW family intramembrane metalloprotease [Lachnospiraceae bacterium]|nr:PrsW family intramembrane metalloprotease [Lachnospiraceae bacterium]